MTAIAPYLVTNTYVITINVLIGWISTDVNTPILNVNLTITVIGNLVPHILPTIDIFVPRVLTVYDEVTNVCVPKLPHCDHHSDCQHNQMCCRESCCPKHFFDQWQQFR